VAAVVTGWDEVDIERDSVLVERFQAGDADAFAELYSRYFARLTRYCRRRVPSESEAEDVAQEAFSRAFRALPAFNGERRFYPWLRVIATNLCVDAHRRARRAPPRVTFEATVPNPEEFSAPSVEREWVVAALNGLPDRQRQALGLRATEGWSHERLADHFGVSTGAVKLLLHRARTNLRAALIEKGAALGAAPGLGAVGRAFRSLRERVTSRASWLTDLSGPVAVTAMSALVASAGIVGGARGVIAPRAANVVAVTQIAAPVVDATPIAAVVAPVANTGSLLTAPADARVPAANDNAGRFGNIIGPHNQERAEQMPIKAETGILGIGIYGDPMTDVRDVRQWLKERVRP
jgi:RNA polymerase sigma-70 factor, ECF subfamily